MVMKIGRIVEHKEVLKLMAQRKRAKQVAAKPTAETPATH